MTTALKLQNESVSGRIVHNNGNSEMFNNGNSEMFNNADCSSEKSWATAQFHENLHVTSETDMWSLRGSNN